MNYPDSRARASANTRGRYAAREGPWRTIFMWGGYRRDERPPAAGKGRSALRQNLLAVGKARVHLGALVVQQPGVGRLDHGEQLGSIRQPGHGDVVGAD